MSLAPLLPGDPDVPRAPTRTVHHADALDWLRVNTPLVNASIITSLPDLSELPSLTLSEWERWFEDAAILTMGAVPEEGVAIFFQSDIRADGRWIDKGALVARAADRAGVALLFHKIVCRKPAGTVTYGRASYSHLLGFSSKLRPVPTRGQTTADVLPDAGFVPGKKSMGVSACLDACRFVQRETTSRIIVDPFCGFGTVLAVANLLGFDAVGVDLSRRMCRRTRSLQLPPEAVA